MSYQVIAQDLTEETVNTGLEFILTRMQEGGFGLDDYGDLYVPENNEEDRDNRPRHRKQTTASGQHQSSGPLPPQPPGWVLNSANGWRKDGVTSTIRLKTSGKASALDRVVQHNCKPTCITKVQFFTECIH